MRGTFFIKPKPGLKIRDPYRGDFLPAEGRKTKMTSFWSRRLKENSIEVSELKTTTAPSGVEFNVLKRGRKSK